MKELPMPMLPLIGMFNFRSPRRQAPAVTQAPIMSPRPSAGEPGLEVVWARHEDEVREAQRLRFQVFATEMGARLRPPVGTPEGLDVDLFDAYCEHLLVRTKPDDDGPARIIGTYRVLTPGSGPAGRRLLQRHRV